MGRFEVLGAWLGVWTPPRDVVVPPVPWPKIVVGLVVAVAALGATAAVVVPRVAEDRQADRERERRADAERRTAFLASVDSEQRPRRADGPADPGGGAPERERRAARARLLAAADAALAADAARRTGRRISGVDCEPFPTTPAAAARARDLGEPAAAFDCVAVTARFGQESAPGGRGVIGIPFRLVARFDRGRVAWCRIVPLSDRDRLSHPLPGSCRVR